MRSLHALLVVALIALGALAAPDLASAHVRPPAAAADVTTSAPADVPAAIVSGTTPAAPLWPLLACVTLAALGFAIAAPRRALYVALALVIATFAVEAGVHSVHHLTDRQAATHCVLSLASAHVQGASAEPSVAPWVPMAVATVTIVDAVRPGASPLRPDEGRAPPA